MQSDQKTFLRWVHPSLYEDVSVRPSVGWSDSPSDGNLFLDASSHLYKRVCPSVRPSVGWSVGNAFFFQIEEMKVFLHV